MIKIAKRRLFSSLNPLRIPGQIILFAFLYIFLPVYLTVSINHNPLLLFAFYLFSFFLVFYLRKIQFDARYRLEYQTQELQEKLNILNDQNLKELKNLDSLKEKIIRYDSLKGIVEEINENLDLDYVASRLAAIAFALIPKNQGSCVLYLADRQTQKLSLFKTKKEDRELVIKAKQGDIFDLWVLRHSSPLLVEDVRKDFRFDLKKLEVQDLRPFSSLIISSLISEHRFLGILRLDNPRPNFYSQDDLRFLMKICDLGAVALENSQLFKDTQDLAIHDALTSIYTKGYFLERLIEECKRGLRQNTIFSLLMLDIDFFKDYNDKFGHAAGDIVLKSLISDMAESLKGLSFIMGRFGGEEFCVILQGIDKKQAYNYACILCERVGKKKIILRRSETNITVSIGIAAFPADSSDEVELIQRADKALYLAKQKGRNRVCCI